MNHFSYPGIHKQKDPTIDKMRLDVFNAMEDILKKEFPPDETTQLPCEVQFVSFEQALRELAAMK